MILDETPVDVLRKHQTAFALTIAKTITREGFREDITQEELEKLRQDCTKKIKEFDRAIACLIKNHNPFK